MKMKNCFENSHKFTKNCDSKRLFSSLIFNHIYKLTLKKFKAKVS